MHAKSIKDFKWTTIYEKGILIDELTHIEINLHEKSPQGLRRKY